MDQSPKYRIEYPNLYAESELLNTYDKYEVDYICQVAGITFAIEDGEYRQQIISTGTTTSAIPNHIFHKLRLNMKALIVSGSTDPVTEI